LLPTWVPVLAVPLLALFALLFAGMILLAVGGDDDPGPLPVINSFTTSSQSVTIDESVVLSWDVVNSERVDLLFQNNASQPQIVSEPQGTSFTMDFDQTGIYTVTLTARSGDQAASEVATIEVRPVVSVIVEVLDEQELVRYVEREVQIRWDVRGAAETPDGYRVWMESSDPSITMPAAPLALSGVQEIKVAPLDNQPEWGVTLYAQGQDDLLATVTQTLTVAFPSCELTAARTIVRGGPGETYPAVVPPLESKPEGNPSLSPIARDPSGDWLQVEIGVDTTRVGWVPRVDFACANFDPSRLIVSIDFPPPPPPTPSDTQDGTEESAIGTPVAPTVEVTVPPGSPTPTRTLPSSEGAAPGTPSNSPG
jgi:hypothetical protein